VTSGAFHVDDVELVQTYGRHRCIGCAAEVTTTEPSTMAPRCARCGDLTAPVSRLDACGCWVVIDGPACKHAAS
jgi:hypothetical protein